jgi:CheY-like chemotaxis protein
MRVRKSSVASSAASETRRVLIVDDDCDCSHLVKVLLEKTGRYVVFEENNATKAYQSARSLRPDVILLDIAMPEADGGDVAAQIDADPALQRTPIIFLTALITETETKAGLRIQGRPAVPKPISIPNLIDRIEETQGGHVG